MTGTSSAWLAFSLGEEGIKCAMPSWTPLTIICTQPASSLVVLHSPLFKLNLHGLAQPCETIHVVCSLGLHWQPY